MADIKNDAGFWQRFWQRIRGSGRLKDGEKAYPFNSVSSQSGSTVTINSSMRLSAVWACVRLRAQTIGSLPLHMKKDYKPAIGHSLYSILHDAPNSDVIAAKFWEAVVTNIDLWGNAYVKIGRVGSSVASLTLLEPDSMVVARDGNKLSYLYKDKSVSNKDLMHIKGLTLDGYIGLSAIEYFAETIGFQSDANKAASTEFKNGLKVGGFIDSNQPNLSQDQRDKFHKWLSEFGQPENSGKWMILETGMKPISSDGLKVKASDAQLLESRQFGIEEICRAFLVPPSLIGHTDKASSWASSLENTNLGFLTYSLTPVLTSIEQEIKRCLMTAEERKIYSVKFSVEGLLRADSKSRSDYLSRAVNGGRMTVNEARELDDLPPMNGGDVLRMQMQMQDINKENNDEKETA